MFKLNNLSAAILVALCGNTLAQDESPALNLTDDSAEFQALATPTPVTTGSTLVKAAPTAAEKTARAYQGWLNQINKPYANQLGTGNGAGVTVGVVDSGVQVSHPS